ncbi:MAG TPA: cystathionine beta-synthase [Chthonomonadaceae bacterium]|nr:cystathionine beta-synthase [Chthonomonadaceae bacterium]
MTTFAEPAVVPESLPSLEQDREEAAQTSRISRDELGIEAVDSVLDLIGETPLLRLNHRLAHGIKPALYAKMEALNPGGSVKDRIGLRMIEAAEQAGLLKKGGTIVEPTSGNTGVGLAMVAALKGYKTVFVMPDKMSQEKISLLKAYGADVIVTPTNVPRESPDSYYSVAERLAHEIPGGFQPNQYFNPNNPQSHYETTGPEIWRQSGGKIDCFIAGVGTGGTITGVARYLKERNPRITIVGVDTEGSLYTNKEVKPYKVEGVGEDFIPGTVDLSLIDAWETISDREAFLMARRMAREEGVLIGGSGGLALAGAVRYARKVKDEKVMVVLLPDSGRSYLSKIFNDDWMRDQGFIDRFGDRREVGHLLPAATRMICAAAGEKVREAIDRMHHHGISQMPVVKGGVPAEGCKPALASLVGVIEERSLLEKVFRHPETVDAAVETVMEDPLPLVNAEADLESLFPLFTDGGNGAVVVRDGEPVGVITRSDLLDFVAHQRTSQKR